MLKESILRSVGWEEICAECQAVARSEYRLNRPGNIHGSEFEAETVQEYDLGQEVVDLGSSVGCQRHTLLAEVGAYSPHDSGLSNLLICQ